MYFGFELAQNINMIGLCPLFEEGINTVFGLQWRTTPHMEMEKVEWPNVRINSLKYKT